MHALNCKKIPLEVLKRTKTILLALYEINLSWLLDEENWQFHVVRSFSVV